MVPVSSGFSVRSIASQFRSCVPAVAMLAVVLAAGCGGGGAGTTFSGNTTVTILATGTENNQWTNFTAGLDTLTLTSQSGTSVNLLSKTAGTEFTHLNGTVEPLLTVSVPQGIYTSATASLTGVGFLCVDLAPGGNGIGTSMYAYNVPIPATSATVTLPKPITISGQNIGLLLDFQVSKSLNFPGGCSSNDTSYTVKPAFVLTSIAIPAHATNSGNGKALNHQGLIASIENGGTTFSVTTEYGPVWQVQSDANTVYQGVTGPSQLAAGLPVDIDAAVQPDGSMLATRIAVYDTNTTDLSVDVGPLLSTNMRWTGLSPSTHLLAVSGGETSWGAIPWMSHFPYWDYTNAVFQISGQLTNLQSLPFTASFTASTMVAGQHVSLTTHVPTIPRMDPWGNPQPPVTTVTLVPQTINGTVEAISSDSGFTTYMVALGSYELFPIFAPQPNPVSVVHDPGTVVVYADSNTQTLNTTAVSAGRVMRFYGLVFNDNGTLRMDCAQINDGVPQ